uniref:Uncharacterized protein n=1 Tax=Lygus hesperus TaxID=30085 RepID=A0A0K8SNK3_LYGHE
MDRWSDEQRSFAVEMFLKNGDSATLAQRRFRTRFNRASRQCSFEAYHTEMGRYLQDKQMKKPVGVQRSVRTPENVERVRLSVEASPGRSLRRQAALRMSYSSVRRILKTLTFHPHKIAITQQLMPRDYVIRMEFAQTMLEMLAEDIVILTSDEAHFHLSGFVNKQNCRYWASQNPRHIHERPLHCERATVWCAVGSVGVIEAVPRRMVQQVMSNFQDRLHECIIWRT